ncbi:MAG: hypothetical protein NVSMB38_00210 [Ktedonobacteraceae bacterium]
MDQTKGLWRYLFTRVVVTATLLSVIMGFGIVSGSHSLPVAQAANGCQLNSVNSNIQHVIYIQFDNTHFMRDNPNVPSDLEQMPHLLNFIKNNGVLLSKQHTPLIAHTADDIVTSLTGVYGDRHGQPVSNTYRYFNPDGTSNLGVSFAYWTDPVFDPTTSSPTNTTYSMLDAHGKNAPAPWVPYTRAGCNVGAVGTANIELENTDIDVAKAYGPNSPQAAEAKANPTKAAADFVGIAVHCAKNTALCSSANTGVSDLLPNEPGGYSGYNALFGHKYAAPQISPNGPLRNLDGQIIQDSNSNIGFPGFDGMQPTNSLAYVAAMQEHGVPVTYAYISAAHESAVTGNAFGPGQADYVAKLKDYDKSFDSFFNRLAKDGINSSNTLFAITADEGDHFVGGPPSPAGCNGVTTLCTYSKIGEVDGNLSGLLATQQHVTTPFNVHADSAPVFYIDGNPSRTATVTRTFEQAVSKLTAVNPITGKTDTLTRYMADPVEMKLLHMITADPARKPTFTMFADPNYYLDVGAPNCSSPCVSEYPPEAWNHGDVYPQINTTWLGMVGPGVKHLGVDDNIWSDHTDTRTTILSLLGLKDDYAHSGRVLFEVLENWAVPDSLRDNRATLTQLAQVFKQINAPVGELGLASLRISSKALESNASGDGTYNQLENKLSAITDQRNSIVERMSAMLEAAAFHNQPINVAQAQKLIQQGQELLERVNALASLT